MSDEPLFDSQYDPAVRVAVDQARVEMVEALHRAVYGETWARPLSPEQVWAELLDRVDRARRQFQR